MTEAVGKQLDPDAIGVTEPPPEVSVLIPHFNDPTNLDLCLAGLMRSTMPRDRFEVIVADNNSSMGLEAVRTVVAGRAIVVPAPEPGAGPARNAAVAHSRGRRLAFIDSDCRPAADWLERGVAALDRADAVGGAVEVSARDRARPNSVEAFEMAFAFRNQRYIEKDNFSVTCNMFVWRKVFDAVGGFRTRVSEDRDWGHRAIAHGYRLIYDGSARIEHPARTDWNALRRKWQRLTSETYRLESEWPMGRLRWVARSWLVLLSPLAHVFVVLRSSDLSGFESRLGAATTLFRLRAFRFAEAYRVLIGGR